MSPILAEIDWGGRMGYLLPVIVVTLSMMIPIVAIITEHFRKRDKMRLMEKAIEHGVDLSDFKLEDECGNKPAPPYQAGMVTFAVGVGLGVGVGDAVWVAVGVGVVVAGLKGRTRRPKP